MRKKEKPTYEEIERRLENAEAALRSLREGQIDAIIGERENLVVKLAEAERREAHIKQILNSIRNAGKLMVRENQRELLIKGVCDKLIETRGYNNAWIALTDGDNNVILTASSGFESEFERMQKKLGRGEFTKCFKEASNRDETIVVDNPKDECRDCPLSNEYENCSGLTRRLSFEKNVYGIITVSIPKSFSKEKDELVLFEELAKDLSIALHNIEIEEKRKSAEESLRKSEKKYRSLFNTMNDGIVYQDAKGNIISANPAAEELLGLTLDQMMGRKSIDKRWKAIKEDGSEFPGEEHPAMISLKTGKPVHDMIMGVFNPKYEDYTWLSINSTPMFRENENNPFQVYATFRDITERKKVQEKQRKLSKRIEAGLRAGNLAWWEMRLPSGEVIFDDRKAELLGYSPSRFKTYQDFTDLLHPDDYELAMQAMRDCLEGKKENYEVEYRIKKSDGAYKWFKDTGIITEQNKENGTVVLIGLVEDIDARKIAGETLRESEQKFRDIFNNSSDAIFIHDPEGNFLEINDIVLERYGYSKEKLLQMTPLDIDAAEFDESYEDKIKTLKEKGRIVFEGVHKRKDGSEFPVEVHSRTIEYEGKPAILSVVRDISERKQAEAKLKEQKELLDESQRLANLGSWELNLIDDKLIWSDEVYRIFGLQPREFDATYEAFLESVHPEDREKVTNAYESSLEKGQESYEIEHRIIKKVSGEIRYVNEKCYHIKDDEGNVLKSIGMVQDITKQKKAKEEQKRLFKELQKSEKKLRELNASKDKFFSIIAHDLKGPFVSFLHLSESLKENYEFLNEEEIRQSVDTIHKTSRNLYKLLQQLLDWSRVQTNRIDFKPDRFDIYELAINNAMLFQKNAEQKNITLETMVKPNTLGRFDYQMIDAVIRNLLSNAIKFTDEGGLVEIKSETLNDGIKITVRDTGVGIDKKHIDKLFSIEEQYVRQGTKKERGTGLGLILSKEFVEKNKGKLEVKSEKGKGSTFSFTLPSINT